jgi:hypothetical protein
MEPRQWTSRASQVEFDPRVGGEPERLLDQAVVANHPTGRAVVRAPDPATPGPVAMRSERCRVAEQARFRKHMRFLSTKLVGV